MPRIETGRIRLWVKRRLLSSFRCLGPVVRFLLTVLVPFCTVPNARSSWSAASFTEMPRICAVRAIASPPAFAAKQ